MHRNVSHLLTSVLFWGTSSSAPLTNAVLWRLFTLPQQYARFVRQPRPKHLETAIIATGANAFLKRRDRRSICVCYNATTIERFTTLSYCATVRHATKHCRSSGPHAPQSQMSLSQHYKTSCRGVRRGAKLTVRGHLSHISSSDISDGSGAGPATMPAAATAPSPPPACGALEAAPPSTAAESKAAALILSLMACPSAVGRSHCASCKPAAASPDGMKLSAAATSASTSAGCSSAAVEAGATPSEPPVCASAQALLAAGSPQYPADPMWPNAALPPTPPPPALAGGGSRDAKVGRSPPRAAPAIENPNWPPPNPASPA
jgi:hypothetical protein